MGPAMITIAELNKKNPEINLLRVRSFDPEIYLVEVEYDNRCYRVIDESGQPVKFRGLTTAKRAFTGLRIKEAVLVHESSDDDMISQSPSDSNHMEVRISVPSD